MYTLYQNFDGDIDEIKYFSTLDKIIEYEKNDSNWLYDMYPQKFIPYDGYIKDAKFISWEYANKNIKTKYDCTVYKLKKVCEWGKGRNVNGDWEYIPIMSCFEDYSIINVWVEIDYSRKIFI